MLSKTAALNKDRRADRSPAFQHRHFAVIARVLAKLSHSADHGVFVELMANELQYTNPRFDRARFLKACGVTE